MNQWFVAFEKLPDVLDRSVQLFASPVLRFGRLLLALRVSVASIFSTTLQWCPNAAAFPVSVSIESRQTAEIGFEFGRSGCDRFRCTHAKSPDNLGSLFRLAVHRFLVILAALGFEITQNRLQTRQLFDRLYLLIDLLPKMGA